MNSDQLNAVSECASLSAAGKISFGDVVARLLKAGIERYHADYSRMETTFYALDGASATVPIEHEWGPVAGAFSAADIEAAVRQSQRGEIKYPQFTQQALSAGCVGYFVQLTGKRVQYFGRNGEIHTEWFPALNQSDPITRDPVH